MEIERKFLIDEAPVELEGSTGVAIVQGYLAIDETAEVRLRRAGERRTLTVKRGSRGSREELEVEMPVESFEELWPGTEGRRVEKVRSRIELGDGLTAEVDEYSGGLDGTSVVEVEFGSGAEAAGFEAPGWFGRELTGDPAWANQSLAVAGRPDQKEEFRLREGEEPGPGIARVIAARTAQAAAAVRRAGRSDGRGADVHEARKSIKKARSALRLLRGIVSDDERRTANEQLRTAAGALAGARDAEVKAATLDAIGVGDPEPPGLILWRRDLEEEAESHRRELTGLRLGRVAASIDAVGARFRGRPLKASPEQVSGNLGRSYRRGRRAMRRSRDTHGAEDFHAWRKRAKDLRYQLEILEPELPEGLAKIRKRAERLADRLGELHDLDVLAEDLAGRALDSPARQRTEESLADARDRQIGICIESGKATYGLKPARFTNRAGESLGGGPG